MAGTIKTNTGETMTDQEINDIEKRCEAATEGPWEYAGDSVWNGTDCICEAISHPVRLNAHFIAHARTDIPNLIKETECHSYR